MTKRKLLNLVKEEGVFFLNHFDKDFKLNQDTDGTYCREYLESKGFKVDNSGEWDCGVGFAKVICGKTEFELRSTGVCSLIFKRM